MNKIVSVKENRLAIHDSNMQKRNFETKSVRIEQRGWHIRTTYILFKEFNIFPIFKGRLNLMTQRAAVPQMSTRC